MTELGHAALSFDDLVSRDDPCRRERETERLCGLEVYLDEARVLASRLSDLGYELIETGMRGRLFLRRRSKEDAQMYHLHIVEQSKPGLTPKRATTRSYSAASALAQPFRHWHSAGTEAIGG